MMVMKLWDTIPYLQINASLSDPVGLNFVGFSKREIRKILEGFVTVFTSELFGDFCCSLQPNLGWKIQRFFSITNLCQSKVDRTCSGLSTFFNLLFELIILFTTSKTFSQWPSSTQLYLEQPQEWRTYSPGSIRTGSAHGSSGWLQRLSMARFVCWGVVSQCVFTSPGMSF